MKKQLVFLLMSLFLFFLLHDFRTNKTIIAVLDTGIRQTKDVKIIEH